ncbi:MAG TPA: type II toxin-antitoxin system HicB family antitoxin, partial [Bradyrhizobium sp.]
GAKSIVAGLHSVGIGDLLCNRISLCRRRIIPLSEPRCTHPGEISGLEAQGASTWGYTREEALANIREVLEMIVGELAEEGGSVPADFAVSEEPLVAVTV